MQAGAAPIVLIVNNRSYGTIRMHQERTYPGRVSFTDIENPDFVAHRPRLRLPRRAGDAHRGLSRRLRSCARISATGAVLELVVDTESLTPRQTLSAMRAAALRGLSHARLPPHPDHRRRRQPRRPPARAASRHLADRVRLVDVQDDGRRPAPHEEIVVCDLADKAAALEVTRDCDAILHFAGHPREQSFEEIIADTLPAAYHVYEGARRHGAKRVVYASSIHAVGFHAVEDGARHPGARTGRTPSTG